jgi:hypothetical protein
MARVTVGEPSEWLLGTGRTFLPEQGCFPVTVGCLSDRKGTTWAMRHEPISGPNMLTTSYEGTSLLKKISHGLDDAVPENSLFT